MISKKAGLLLAGALLMGSGIANAEVLTFHFKGTVTYGGPFATVGDEVTGHFCYDTDTDVRFRQDGYANYAAPPECKIVVRVGTLKATSKQLSISIWNNFGGNVEDMLDMAGNTATIDGVDYPNGTVDITLATGPGNTKVFRSTNLRERFKIADFDAMSGGVVQTDGSPTGARLYFTITSMSVVD